MLRENRKFKVGGSSGGLLASGARRLPKASYLVPGIAIGLLGFLSITAVCPSSLFGIGGIGGAYAEEMTLSAILTPSITLSMSSSVSENIEPTVDGAFKNLATVARVQVMNSEYYDVSIFGNSDMVGTTNPDSKISAISGEKKASEFEDNTWGYNVSKNDIGVTTAVAATSSTVYKPVPATSTQIVSRQATTNNAADDYYSLNFGAKVDTSIPADTYTSRVMLSVTASPVQATEYSLTYNANNGSGAPARQTASSYDTSYEFTVASGAPTRSGYTFLGWADSSSVTAAQYTTGSKITVAESAPNKTVYAVWVANTNYSVTYDGNGNTDGAVPAAQAVSNNNASQTFTAAAQGGLYRAGYVFQGWADTKAKADAGTVDYASGAIITLTKAAPTKTLYAVWKASAFSSITTMQELTTSVCQSTAVGGTARLTDARDNRMYWVAKLPDNNCWMTQNLDYAIPNSTLNLGISKTADNAWFWENGLRAMSAAAGSMMTTIDSTWTASNDADFYTKNGNNALNSSTKTYDAHYMMGNYYQYSAALKACPAGWGLPTANQAATVNGSYNKLIVGQSVNSLLAKPYFFIYSGGVEGQTGKLNSVGTYGYFWSATYNSTSGFGLYVLGSGIDPSSAGGKADGYPVRCYVNGN